ncbi:hypothetical protein GQ43DRAFT_464485 [Delitschia confertaspora ATCC 74209]|uniref:Myb-like domain-containing protein n=1 Tax=Delitschia confertaspora ATCC 74209 TaxID=1513339 RepID=A0A9P4JI64_9PLEO|nr:hypothetical protein GQ43DRAFT_464485 [Delitschia confertaspora ATCC 74209]
MASRGVRSSSRRVTPAPQAPSKQNMLQPRVTRSQSRDLEDNAQLHSTGRVSTRRTARQTSMESDNTRGSRVARQTKGKATKQVIGDLTTVEEAISEPVSGNIPQTPPPNGGEGHVPHRSPGGLSEMSGTTAADAEDLNSEFILEYGLVDLYHTSKRFLNLLARDRGAAQDDVTTMKDLRKPESSLNERFRTLDLALDSDLNNFRKPPNLYISRQTVIRALLGREHVGAELDVASIRTPADLVMYKANLVVFARQMITSDRGHKAVWDAIRQLDVSFPTLFLPKFEHEPEAGSCTSRLLDDTFKLALEIRTQLTILVLSHMMQTERDLFDPDNVVQEIFLEQAGNDDHSETPLRGWGVDELGGNGTVLSDEFRAIIVERVKRIREFFPRDAQSLQNKEYVDIESLGGAFNWDQFVLKLLRWVRLRNREIDAAIGEIGGIDGLVEGTKKSIAAANVPSRHLKQRTSTGKERRRTSRRFDPETSLDDAALEYLKARMPKTGEALVQPKSVPSENAVITQQQFHEVPHATDANQYDEWQQVLSEEEAVEEPVAQTSSNLEPPTSSAAVFARIKRQEKIEKENRKRFIDRQPNAERISWDDGLEEPSSSQAVHNKEKQPEQPSKKRQRPVEDEGSDEEDDTFETDVRSVRTKDRRKNAPVRKKAHFGAGVFVPSSSAPAPPSHQPAIEFPDDFRAQLGEEEDDEELKLELATTQPPPSSNLDQIRQLGKMHRVPRDMKKPRKDRTNWTKEEEDAFMHYMEMFPQRYSVIKDYDQGKGGNILEDRDQVALKDKARNIARNFIEAQCGVPDPFKDIIKPESRIGQQLVAKGFRW